MKTRLLTINASARSNRSVTRGLVDQLAAAWLSASADGAVVSRDVGLNPPSAIDQEWIASAYAPAGDRTPAMRACLAESDTLIGEIEAADAIVIGTPLYNFGMPAVLKLWVEQIIRVGRTFEIMTGQGGESYRPLLAPKPVVVVVAAGNGAFLNGGSLAAFNFLEAHLRCVLEFIGFKDVTFIQVAEADAKSGAARPPGLDEAAERLRQRAVAGVTAAEEPEPARAGASQDRYRQ